jgi:hypothetical protein
MTKYYVCLLPNGNEEFDEIEKNLEKLKIKYVKRDVYKRGSSFSRIYRISISEAVKLPAENGVPWLPVDEDSGHKLILDKDGKIWKLCLNNETLE